MKRNLLLGVVATVTIGLLAFQAMAQEGAPRRAAAQAKPNGRPGDPEVLVSRLTEAFQLTAEQAAKLKQILQTFRQANENWVKEHGQEFKDAQEQLAAARQAGNRAEARSALEAVEQIQAARKELLENVRKQLADVPLTAEQIEKVMGVLAPAAPQRLAAQVLATLGKLDLSQEQKGKVRAILQQAQADVEKAEGPKAKAEALKAVFEKIKTDVLTEDQRKKLAESQTTAQAGDDLAPALARALAGLKLSDEQRTKVRALWAEALKNADPAQNKRVVLREAIKKIAEDVLTPEQQEQLKKSMEDAAPAPARRPGAAAGK